jgi:hypothetical protein
VYFRCSQASQLGVEAILRFMGEFPPKEVVFLFDRPMSHSGWLAEHVRGKLKAYGLDGDARTAAMPGREFRYEQGVVASSDQSVIDASCNWLDLARRVIDWAGWSWRATDFTGLFQTRLTTSAFTRCPLWDCMLLVKKDLLC